MLSGAFGQSRQSKCSLSPEPPGICCPTTAKTPHVQQSVRSRSTASESTPKMDMNHIYSGHLLTWAARLNLNLRSPSKPQTRKPLDS